MDFEQNLELLTKCILKWSLSFPFASELTCHSEDKDLCCYSNSILLYIMGWIQHLATP